MTRKIFISYRRKDSKYQAREVYRALRTVLPDEHVFMDVDSIPLGANFRQVLSGWVEQCDILLALVGPDWLDSKDPQTRRRRLDNACDFVRIEIGEALARGIPVVPILLDGAGMPDAGALPDNLKELVDRQAEFIEYRTMDHDVQRLIHRLGLNEVAVAGTSPVAGRSRAMPQPQRGWRPGQIICDAPFAPEMVVIPPGTFMMGTPAVEIKALKRQYKRDYFDREHPQHEVTISRSFAMGRYAVTRKEFSDFVEGSGYEMPDKAWTFEDGKYEERSGRSFRNPGFEQEDDHPVVCVSWDDAQAYIKWMNGKTGETYRLPTEAEWEYACRAGTVTPFWTGESLSTDQANYNGNHPHNGPKGDYREKTVPVDSFEPNPFGLYQVHGNVLELCNDWYGDYKSGSQTDPQGPASGSPRLNRGGCWYSNAWSLRSANRYYDSPDYRSIYLGFRLLRQPS